MSKEERTAALRPAFSVTPGESAMPIAIRNVIKGQAPTEKDIFQFFGMPDQPRAVREDQPKRTR